MFQYLHQLGRDNLPANGVVWPANTVTEFFHESFPRFCITNIGCYGLK